MNSTALLETVKNHALNTSRLNIQEACSLLTLRIDGDAVHGSLTVEKNKHRSRGDNGEGDTSYSMMCKKGVFAVNAMAVSCGPPLGHLNLDFLGREGVLNTVQQQRTCYCRDHTRNGTLPDAHLAGS